MSVRKSIQKDLVERGFYPKWLEEFMSDKRANVIFGNYKIIYIFEDNTISVQKKGSNPSSVYFDLSTVECQDHLNYPKELHSVVEVYI